MSEGGKIKKGSSKSKTTRILNSFSSIFRSPLPKVSPDVSFESFPLLELPRSVRVIIWKLLGFSHTKRLRLVCSLIKEDIDHFTGISSAIDSTFDDFPFHCNTAIRKVAIHELIIPRQIEFLKYPLILEELEIRGEITLQNFQYILKSCPNISKLLIIFNKYVLDYGTPFFPLPVDSTSPRPLNKLRSLKLISTTKKLADMIYVHRTVVSLLRDTLSNVTMHSLNVSVTHKAACIYLKEIIWTTLVFVHKQAPTLRELNLTFRDKMVNSAAPVEKPPEKEGGNTSEKASTTSLHTQPDQGTTKNDKIMTSDTKANEESIERRDTAAVFPLLPGVVITHHVKDIHREDSGPDSEGDSEDTEESSNAKLEVEILSQAVKYLNSNKWPAAIYLENLWLAVPLDCMEELLKMISPKTKLQIIQLEAISGIALQANWNVYEQFITRCDSQVLKNATFFGVVNVDPGGSSIPINLRIFRKSKKLKKLSIFAQKRNDYRKLTPAKGVSRLPTTLNEVIFERILMTPCQVTRLMIFYREMVNVSLSYWSISDCQFALLMTMLKWIIKLALTRVSKLTLVDTKLRFKNKRDSVRKLQQGVKISVKYLDLDETKLIIDRNQKRDDKSLAPIAET